MSLNFCFNEHFFLLLKSSAHSKLVITLVLITCWCFSTNGFSQRMDTLRLTNRFDYTDLNSSTNFYLLMEHPKRLKFNKKRVNVLATHSIDTLHKLTLFIQGKELDETDSNWQYNNPPESILIMETQQELYPNLNLTDVPKGKYLVELSIGLYRERFVLKIKHK